MQLFVQIFSSSYSTRGGLKRRYRRSVSLYPYVIEDSPRGVPMSSLAGVRANNLNNAQDTEFPNSVLDGATPGVTGE